MIAIPTILNIAWFSLVHFLPATTVKLYRHQNFVLARLSNIFQKKAFFLSVMSDKEQYYSEYFITLFRLSAGWGVVKVFALYVLLMFFYHWYRCKYYVSTTKFCRLSYEFCIVSFFLPMISQILPCIRLWPYFAFITKNCLLPLFSISYLNIDDFNLLFLSVFFLMMFFVLLLYARFLYCINWKLNFWNTFNSP